MTNMTIQDRLYIDVNVRPYLEKIKKFFSNSIENKDIFFYAVALGIKMPTPIEGKKDGFFMTKLLNKDDEVFLHSLLMEENFDLENIDDRAVMYKKAEECANTGFNILKDMIDSSSSEMLMKKLLVDLEEDFEKIEDQLMSFEDIK
jgi:hypothetical protein